MSHQSPPYAHNIRQFIEQCNQIMGEGYHTLPISEQRELYERLCQQFSEEAPANIEVHDHIAIGGGVSTPFRIYRRVRGGMPGNIMYIRGGGFVLGSLNTHDSLISEFCEATGITVIVPDFSLSPETIFPRAIEDCERVLDFASQNRRLLGLDSSKFVLMGDSSGGNMVVAMCMRLRDCLRSDVRAHVLINPVLNFARWQSGGGDAPLLTGGEMEFYTACYAGGDLAEHEHVSPLLRGTFNNLPPAFVMGAELDSLKQDSIDYVARLRDAGIAAQLRIEPGLVHGSLRARNMSAGARNAFLEVSCAAGRFCADAVREAGQYGDR